jgi:aldose 1-epimerase
MAVDLRPSPAYPFAIHLVVEYRLGRDGLTVRTEAENTGGAKLPFGLGFHPYLAVGTANADQIRMRIPAAERLITDEQGLPTGRAPVAGTEFDFRQGRLIGVTKLDTGFTGLARATDGRSCVELDHPDGGGGSTVWADEPFGYFMVYTGDTLAIGDRRTAVAVEPMTCPPDAFRSGIDLVTLEPGARWSGSWGITPR